MSPFPHSRLNALAERATLIGLQVGPSPRLVTLRLGVPAGGEAGGPRDEWIFLLHGVSRVAAWLRGVRYDPDPDHRLSRPGRIVRVPRDIHPPERVRDLQELNGWLRLWSGHTLSGQPREVFDTAQAPAWLGSGSLDLAWPDAAPGAHSLDLWLGDNPAVGGRMLSLRVEFGRLETVRRSGVGPDAGPAARRGRGPDSALAGAGTGPGRPAAQRRTPGRRAQAPGPRTGARRKGAATAAAAVAVGVILAGWFATRPGSVTNPPNRTTPAQPAAAQRGLPAAEAGLMPWHLAVPISREVVVTGTGGQLIVLGGLTAGGASANGVYALRPVSGAVHRIGALRAPLHDAAAAVIGRRALVFGGGSSATVSTVEAFTLHGQRRGAPQATAADAGSMPTPRSDAAAVTAGGATYVVGGYNGAHADTHVLVTTSGRSFATVASLPVPVRYPAVAALGGRIYVFGGQAATGPHAGAPVDVIQAVDPAHHTAAVVGHLPEPLAGAAAMTVDGEVFVAGGESSVRQRLTPGLGTTQLGPSELSATPAGNSSPRTWTVSTVWAFNPTTRRLLTAGRLQVPVSHAAVAVTGSTAWIVGGESHGALVAAVQMLRPDKAFGTAGASGAGSPYFGARLLIADRGNNRLLFLNAAMHLVWKYPSAHSPRDPLRFYFPDDAFFIDHGTAILSNQEQNETIIKIAYPSGKITWSYGHPHHPGTAPGYLYEPDDAYLLKNGQITVADANNCRVLVINPNGTVAHQIGTNGVCVHHPPASLGSPNGDTPLANGNLLISEINGSWVSEYTKTGKLVWTTRLPISYPSDPQQLGPNRYLIADYAFPGQIVEFNRQGRILFRYHPSSGPGELNHPSLAEVLPSGVIMVNDDYNDRMVAIDPATGALVWQYGVTGRHGTAPGRLHTPDGFDLLLPNGSTPTHPVTG